MSREIAKYHELLRLSNIVNDDVTSAAVGVANSTIIDPESLFTSGSFTHEDFIRTDGTFIYATFANLFGFLGSEPESRKMYFELLKYVISKFEVSSEQIKRNPVCGRAVIDFQRKDVFDYLVAEHGFTTEDFCASERTGSGANLEQIFHFAPMFEQPILLDSLVDKIADPVAKAIISEILATGQLTGGQTTSQEYQALYKLRYPEILRRRANEAIAAEFTNDMIESAICAVCSPAVA
jgi:hypothetical protein